MKILNHRIHILIIIVTILDFSKTLSLKSPSTLINDNQVNSIIKTFDSSFNIDNACVTCRYIVQKMFKVLEIDSSCTDIVQTKLINQKENIWKADPEIINKWSILFNLQKDYYTRILPQIQSMQNYNEKLHTQKLREKEYQRNLKNLMDFENRINLDLKKEEEVLKVVPVKETVVTNPIPAEEIHSVGAVQIPSVMDFIFKQKEKKEDMEEPEPQREESISNPPQLNFTSFLEVSLNSQKQSTTFDREFNELLEKTNNYNLQTQRRGRRLSKYPDPQWDCAELQISKVLRYLCEEEISSSFQKYCNVLFKQINTITESFLYHDNNIEICQNVYMCPFTSEFP